MRRSNRMQIIVSELPYQVNKAALVEKVAALVKDRKIEGISDLRDESDREGMRVVFELRAGGQPMVVLNNPVQVHRDAELVLGQHARAGR